MNKKSKIQRIVTTVTTITALATVLGGCDATDDREPEVLDRGDDDSVAVQIANYSADVIFAVVDGNIQGALESFIFGSGDETVSLSDESLSQIESVVEGVIDAKEWENEDRSLRSVAQFISEYERFQCVGTGCDPYSESLWNEELVQGYSEGIAEGWNFYAAQSEPGRQLSSISQMMIIAPLRMMLLQEIAGLRVERDLDVSNAVENLRNTACSYRDKLQEFRGVFDQRHARYGQVELVDYDPDCREDGENIRCDVRQDWCFDNPRDERNCERRDRWYYQGLDTGPDWGDGQNLDQDQRERRESWMAEDYSKILGGDAFQRLVDGLDSICNNPPQPSPANVKCDELTNAEGTQFIRGNDEYIYRTPNLADPNQRWIFQQDDGHWVETDFSGEVFNRTVAPKKNPYFVEWESGRVICSNLGRY
ncbi:MAG: hypothetical protein AB1Z98_09210 [Nannocystaceae bacterium]